MDAAVGFWSAVWAGLAALMLAFSCIQKKKPKVGVKQTQPKQFEKHSREKAQRRAAAEEEQKKSKGLESAEFTVKVEKDGGGLNPAALEGEENQPQLTLRHLVYAQAANIRAEAEAQKKRDPTSTNQQ